jgi:hypothetical protein
MIQKRMKIPIQIKQMTACMLVAKAKKHNKKCQKKDSIKIQTKDW